MKINKYAYIPNFSASNVQEDDSFADETEENLIKKSKENKYFNLAGKDKSNNDRTLFEFLIDKDYWKFLGTMSIRNYDFSDAVRELIQKHTKNPAIDKLTQKDIENIVWKLDKIQSSSSSMKIIIARILNNNINKLIPPSSTDDAKTVSAQLIVKGNLQSKYPVSQNTPPIESIKTENSTNNTSSDGFWNDAIIKKTVNNDEQTNIPNQTGEEINLEGLDELPILKTKPDDIVSMEKLIGLEKVKEELEINIIGPLRDNRVKQKSKANNIDLPNGILITGGTSSLTVIKALSEEAKLPVVIMNAPNQLMDIMAAVEQRYKSTGLKTAILAQGFDKFLSNELGEININTFKNNLKGIKDRGGLLIATADNKDCIRCDFMVSGIIDKIFELKKPNFNERKKYIKEYFKDKEVFNDLNNDKSISNIAKLTENMTHSDILRILADTARTAIHIDKNANMDIFNKQLEEFSQEKGIEPITEENKTSNYDEKLKRIPIEEGEMKSIDELGGMPEVKKMLYDLYIDPMNKIKELKEQLYELYRDDPVKEIEEFKKKINKDALPDGAIFYGPPGNGKTITARALARHLGLPYYEIRTSDFATAYVHESGKAFQRLIEPLIKKFQKTGEFSVVFLDEFDSLGASRNGDMNHYHDNELTNTLLQILSEPQKHGIILIAATNNLKDVDSALKRRGRLGNHIEFGNPNQEEREDAIRKILSKNEITKEFANDNDFVTSTAKELDGFSMACLSYTLKDATRDFDIHKTEFKTAVKKALDANIKRELEDYADKAHLTQHQYGEFDYKSLDELGGMSEVAKELRSKVIAAWNPETRKEFIENRISPPGGFILEGPPATGKTTIIETLAREMDVPLFKMNYNQKDNQYIHKVTEHVSEIFDYLALLSKYLKKPVMLFFDEAERFFPNLTKLNHLQAHSIEEVNTYKDLMNNAAQRGIILAGATNHINQVNQEIIGNKRRMGTVISCLKPNLEEREDIIKKLVKNRPRIRGLFTYEDIKNIAEAAEDSSIGELSKKIDEIIIQAIIDKEYLSPEIIVKKFQKKD